MSVPTLSLLPNEGDAFTRETHAGRDEWVPARAHSIGASEIAAVLDWDGRRKHGTAYKRSHPYLTPWRLWALKVGLQEPSTEETRMQRFGKRVEPIIAEDYEDATGRQLGSVGEHTILRSKRWPFLTCTLDRAVLFDPRVVPAEFKAVNFARADDWIADVPRHFRAQLQSQMAVGGWDAGSIGALFGYRDFRWRDFDRNEAFIAEAVKVCAEFWERHVLAREPPEPEADDASDMKRIYLDADEAEAPTELDGDCHTLAEKWEEAREAEKAANERKKKIEALLVQRMNGHRIGVLPNGDMCKVSVVPVAQHVRKASERRTFTVVRKES